MCTQAVTPGQTLLLFLYCHCLQVKMKIYKHCRPYAASAWANAGGDMTKANTMFLDTCKSLGLELPEAPSKFVRYWGEQYATNNHWRGNAGCSGRKPLIPHEAAKQCVDAVLNWREAGLAGPYRSLRDLIAKSEVVADIMQQTGASQRTLARAMQRLCPTLSYKRLVVKAKLTATHKQQRVAVCSKHLQVPDSTLETVVWIDAKTMHMNITDRYGWVDSSKEDIYETTHSSTKKSNIIKLKYYIAVNARLGAVLLVFNTGTTGMPAERDGKTYLVGLCNVEFSRPPSISITDGLLDFLQPSPASALSGVSHQPHHTVSSLHCRSSQCMVSCGSTAQAAVNTVAPGVQLACVLLTMHLN